MSTLMGESVAHHNLRSILRVVQAHGAVSRRGVADETGLSTPTVTRHVNELVEAGVLRSAPATPAANGPGRPPRELELEPGFGFTLGVDVGEHTFRAAVADFAGATVAASRRPSAARRGREASLDRLAEAISEVLEAAGLASSAVRRRLHAAVVGVPGIVDVDDGRVLDAPNLPGWHDLALRDELRERLGLEVEPRIENDVNLAAVGEAYRGAGRGHRDFVFVSVRRGIGAGIFLDGRLQRGHAGMAGELGFMATSHEFDHRAYGGLGHLETSAGEQALLERVQNCNTSRSGVDEEPSMRDICLAARDGDSAALEVLEDAFRRYGVAVANVVSILDPELVVLGGDVVLVGDAVVRRIREVLHRLVPHAPVLRSSVLGEDAALQGALQQAHMDACDLVPGVIHPLGRGGTA